MTRRTSRAAQYTVDPVMIARAALRRGVIEKHRFHYRFGHRLLNPATVNVLLASGEARRLPDGRVVAAERYDEAAQ